MARRARSVEELTQIGLARARAVRPVPELNPRKPWLVKCAYPPCQELVDRSKPRCKHQRYHASACKWAHWNERNPRQREHRRGGAA